MRSKDNGHRGRWLWLIAAALVLAGVLLPVGRSWDPRGEEIAAEQYRALLKFSGTRTRAEVEAALRLVDPEGHLAAHHRFVGDVLQIRREGMAGSPWPSETDGARVVPVRLRAAPMPAPPPPVLRKVAIDPGHFGGAWAQRENRHIVREGGHPVREGDLAWATARLVQSDLRRAGVQVELLRGPPPQAPFPAGADARFEVVREAGLRLAEQRPEVFPWLTPLSAGQLWWARRQLAATTPFELYQRYDLRRRAEVAGAFAPDITVSLHYNTTDNDDNGVVVFVPGNFLAGDFATAAQRYWAFVRVLDGTAAEQQRRGQALGRALAQHLGLPAFSAASSQNTGAYWRPVDPAAGVYARNLAILRRTPGIVLLLEGPCVNQSEEYQRLQAAGCGCRRASVPGACAAVRGRRAGRLARALSRRQRAANDRSPCAYFTVKVATRRRLAPSLALPGNTGSRSPFRKSPT